MMIDVIGVRPLGGHKLEVEFSDGTVGVRDFSFVADKAGAMAEPLKDTAYFARVFIDDGALTWPNGYDWDPTALRDEMASEGQLRPKLENVVYRRGRGGDTWHFVTNCTTWPTRDYEEASERPASGAICNECSAKAAAYNAVFRRAS